MTKRETQKGSVSIFSPTSIVGAFILYFVVPTLLFVQYVELPSDFFLSSIIPSKASYDKVTITSTTPSTYSKEIQSIQKQQRQQQIDPNINVETRSDTSSKTIHTPEKKPLPTTATTASRSVNGIDAHINNARQVLRNNPDDIFSILNLAEALTSRDLMYHDGGSTHQEAMSLYSNVIQRILQKREDRHDKTSSSVSNLNSEIFLDNKSKSMEGLLIHVCCRLAHVYFMANMFEIAVGVYTQALEISSTYLDALNHRGTTYLILGKYSEAAQDFDQVIQYDTDHVFIDVYTGMAKVLVAREDVYPPGWEKIVPQMEALITSTQHRLQLLSQQQQGHDAATISTYKNFFNNNLKHLHLALFSYHDYKTLDVTQAWDHVVKGNYYKLDDHAPYDYAFQQKKIDMIKQVFTPGFWVDGIGSPSKNLIFIVGFVRSGSTLLERILDAHPLIAGTGEDSIFNGRLPIIRSAVVEASTSGSLQTLQSVVQQQADEVEFLVKERWDKVHTKSSFQNKDIYEQQPRRYADKMLTNYMNIGFIHLLYPNALILHVSREPMDTLWSAFKHDFPPGDLDYTSDFQSLAHMFKCYREVMRHWDQVLPGRIIHIRYEDMVKDFDGVAKAVISATGLPWDPEVLNFHEKKQAVNTLSTSQVRKGIYKESIQSWKRYEKHLKPLMRLVGDDTIHNIATSLKGYTNSNSNDVQEESTF